MKPLIPVRADLVGKGGVGLAMFHLARLGFEFVPTAGHSAHGDLWVRFTDTPEATEVKTTRGGSWNLRADQMARVSRIIFVDMDDGTCWMAMASNVTAFCSTRKSMNLSWRHMEAVMATPWHREIPKVCPKPRVPPASVTPGARGNRKVKKVLADGTIKIYEYAGLQTPNKRQTRPASD